MGLVGATLGALLALPALIAVISAGVARWLPSSVGAAVSSLDPASAGMDRWTAALVLGAWVLGALVAAAAVLRRRDA